MFQSSFTGGTFIISRAFSRGHVYSDRHVYFAHVLVVVVDIDEEEDVPR